MTSPSSASCSTVDELKRVIYTESPYAAALEQECLQSYCAACFKSCVENYPCPNGCPGVIYCSETCSSNDRPWHETECTAYRHPDTFQGMLMGSLHVRFAARLLSRLKVDAGVVSLAEGIPVFVKERRFSDLISHYDNIMNDPKRKKALLDQAGLFQNYFSTTSLATTSAQEIVKIMCIAKINSFSIGANDTVIGVGLYLNTSRFNHSCRSNAYVRFDGCRLKLMAGRYVHPDEYNNERRFNQLTVNYGTPQECANGCTISRARQRINSLKYRYFFRCICSRCVSAVTVLLEERASSTFCDQCQYPYYWTASGELCQSCMCDLTAPVKATRSQKRAVIQLDKNWEKIMDETATMTRRKVIIRLCKPLWETAVQYWHPFINLRLAQVVERLVEAYSTVKSVAVTQEDVKAMKECWKMLNERHGGNSWWWRSLHKRYKFKDRLREMTEAVSSGN